MSTFDYEAFRESLDQGKFFKVKAVNGISEVKRPKEMTRSELADLFAEVGFIKEGKQLLRENI